MRLLGYQNSLYKEYSPLYLPYYCRIMRLLDYQGSDYWDVTVIWKINSIFFWKRRHLMVCLGILLMFIKQGRLTWGMFANFCVIFLTSDLFLSKLDGTNMINWSLVHWKQICISQSNLLKLQKIIPEKHRVRADDASYNKSTSITF